MQQCEYSEFVTYTLCTLYSVHVMSSVLVNGCEAMNAVAGVGVRLETEQSTGVRSAVLYMQEHVVVAAAVIQERLCCTLSGWCCCGLIESCLVCKPLWTLLMSLSATAWRVEKSWCCRSSDVLFQSIQAVIMDFCNFVLQLPLEQCWRHYVFGLSFSLSLWTQYLINCLWNFTIFTI